MAFKLRTILDELQDLGFMPDPDGRWFDRHSPADKQARILRVVLDDTDVIIHMLEGNEVCCWTVTFSSAPVDLIATNLSIIIGRWLV
jgi:hypothetical protein